MPNRDGIGGKRACELKLKVDLPPCFGRRAIAAIASYQDPFFTDNSKLRENELTAMPQTGPFLGIPNRVNYGHPVPHTKTAPIFL